MKKLFIALIILLFAVPSIAAEIKFEWSQTITSDFAGWKLYQGLASGNYTKTYDIVYSGTPGASRSTTITIPAIEGSPVIYYYALTSYDDEGNESDHSNEVTYTAEDSTSPAVPESLTVTIIQK